MSDELAGSLGLRADVRPVETALNGDVRDRVELSSLLQQLSDLGLEVVEFRRTTRAAEHDGSDGALRRIVVAAAHERARIERDLHDGAQQRLIALRIKVSAVAELMSAEPEAAAGVVRELGSDLDLALEELRALAHGIYPSALADHGLETALRGLAVNAPMPVSVTARGLRRHAPEIESALYFTCVEALQNATKHAHGATGVWISLREDRTLALEVRDDGPGFLPLPNGFSRGLRSMTDRIEAVGGQLTIDSEPGRGTRLVATVAAVGSQPPTVARER